MKIIQNSFTQTSTSYIKSIAKEKKEEQSYEAASLELQSTDKEKIKATYERPKKLTDKQVEALKEHQKNQEAEMLKKLAGGNVAIQSKLVSGSSEELLKDIFGSVENALPELATTPEEAAKAIEPGGAYSVEAVTERIMKMAKAFAGDNPEMIETMKGAVQMGFEQAGMDLETGEGLPEICYDTYESVMSAFETWKEEV